MRKTLVIFLLALGGCSSVKITGVDKAEDFSLAKYKTFSFYEVNTGGDALGPNAQANLKVIKEAIVKELGARGLSQAADNPDMLVNIGVVVTEETQTRETSFTNPADRTYYMGQRTYSWQSQEVEVGKYREGTVTVHLVDPASNKLIWKGSAESVLPNKEKNVPSLIDEGMRALFAKVK